MSKLREKEWAKINLGTTARELGLSELPAIKELLIIAGRKHINSNEVFAMRAAIQGIVAHQKEKFAAKLDAVKQSI